MTTLARKQNLSNDYQENEKTQHNCYEWDENTQGKNSEEAFNSPNDGRIRHNCRRNTFTTPENSNENIIVTTKPTHRRTISGSHDYYCDLFSFSTNQSPPSSEMENKYKKVIAWISNNEYLSVNESNEFKWEAEEMRGNDEKQTNSCKKEVKTVLELGDFEEMIKVINERENTMKHYLLSKKKEIKEFAIKQIKRADSPASDADKKQQKGLLNIENNDNKLQKKKEKFTHMSEQVKRDPIEKNKDHSSTGFFRKSNDNKSEIKNFLHKLSVNKGSESNAILISSRKINLGKKDKKGDNEKPEKLEKPDKPRIVPKKEARTGTIHHSPLQKRGNIEKIAKLIR
ncbi:unnamed protein product [Blepharisma stoltei]|uniref:Uncharacterized protein n=1 Tax=Blepharisma stoltei TaxID=1481888 RepID=A0AAU9K3J9_9CILI|nr:unnamed protein product [Blepharisma stoltei]